MSGKGAFFSPGRKPLFPFLKKKAEAPTGQEVEAQEADLSVPQQGSTEEISERTIGGVPMEWPNAQAVELESAGSAPKGGSGWGGQAGNPWSGKADASPETFSEEPMEWAPPAVLGGTPRLPDPLPQDRPAGPAFALNGSPLPSNVVPLASFSPSEIDPLGLRAIDPEVQQPFANGAPSPWPLATAPNWDELISGQENDSKSVDLPTKLEVVQGGSESSHEVSEGTLRHVFEESASEQGELDILPESVASFSEPIAEPISAAPSSMFDWEPGPLAPVFDEEADPQEASSCELTATAGDSESGITQKPQVVDDAVTVPVSESTEEAQAVSTDPLDSGFKWEDFLASTQVKGEPSATFDQIDRETPTEPAPTVSEEPPPPPAWGAPAWGRPFSARKEAVPPVEPAVESVLGVPDVQELRPAPDKHEEAVSETADDVPLHHADTLPEPTSELTQPEERVTAWSLAEPEAKASLRPRANQFLEPPLYDLEHMEAPTEFLPQTTEVPPKLPEPILSHDDDFALNLLRSPDEVFQWPELGDDAPSEEEVLARVWRRDEQEPKGQTPAVEDAAANQEGESFFTPPPVPEPASETPTLCRADLEVAAFDSASVSSSLEPVLDAGVAKQEMPLREASAAEAVLEVGPAIPEAALSGPVWQEPEPEPEAPEPENSQTWGLPTEWSSPAAVHQSSNPGMVWVGDEEEAKEQPEPQPKRQISADFEAQFEQSLETLFTRNRDFKWKKVGELLQELGLVSDADLAEALAIQSTSKKPLGRILVDQGIISDRLLLKVLAAQKDVIPCFIDAPLEPDLLALLEPEFCLRCQVLPVRQKGHVLTLAMRNPSDVDTIDFVAQTTGLAIEPGLADEDTLARKIDEAYSRDARSHRAHVNALVQEAIKTSDIKVVNIDDSKSVQAIEEETRPVSAIVHKLITEGVKMRASDIHMEPTLHDLQIRYRIDGRLHKVNSVPRELQPMILARVKILAELDPVEWRIPQDGRISFDCDGKIIDLRVSVLPSFYGGRIVMRILDRSIGLKKLEDIGFSQSNLTIFRTLIKRPYGLFLVTGPTGSGKTTSLYAALNEVKDEETNIITCEDPVEYNLEGISQSQVNAKIGLTFAAQLRSILRQDPDVVLVGEIRDHETAETAIRASMTGHLVFSTLHCNDAPSAIPRLLDMNIDPYLLSTSLIGVMGQRLLRRICPDCGHEYAPTDEEKTILERTFGLVGVDKLFKGEGCVRCAHTGFKGRFAVHEIMPVTQEISSHISVRAATEKLAEVSRAYGYRTMQEDAIERVLAGQTSLREAQRLLAFDDIPKSDTQPKKKA